MWVPLIAVLVLLIRAWLSLLATMPRHSNRLVDLALRRLASGAPVRNGQAAESLHIGTKSKLPKPVIGELQSVTAKVNRRLEKRYGIPHAAELAQSLQPSTAQEVLQFGHEGLDLALRNKQTCKGEIVEISGAHGWLCSALAAHAAAEQSRNGQRVLWLGAHQPLALLEALEQSLQGRDVEYKSAEPRSRGDAELCLKAMVQAVRSQKYSLVVLDSIPGLAPYNKDERFRHLLLPLMLDDALRDIGASCGSSNRTTTMLLNQQPLTVFSSGTSAQPERWAGDVLERRAAVSLHLALVHPGLRDGKPPPPQPQQQQQATHGDAAFDAAGPAPAAPSAEATPSSSSSPQPPLASSRFGALPLLCGASAAAAAAFVQVNVRSFQRQEDGPLFQGDIRLPYWKGAAG